MEEVVVLPNDPKSSAAIESLEREILVEGMLRAIARGADFRKETIVRHSSCLKHAKMGQRIVHTRTIEFDDGTAFSVWFEYTGGSSMRLLSQERTILAH